MLFKNDPLHRIKLGTTSFHKVSLLIPTHKSFHCHVYSPFRFKLLKKITKIMYSGWVWIFWVVKC